MKPILLITVVAALFVSACCKPCQRSVVVLHDPTVELAAEGRECPHDPGLVVPLSGNITAVPEFHDCQRFIVKNGDEEVYDSLYAIFASSWLATLRDSIDTGRVANQIEARPAATVVSYGGTYKTLNIEDGYNCLYLWWNHAFGWRAWMINNAADENGCSSRLKIDLSNPPHELKVVPQTSSFNQGADYPPVARWDWDAGGQEHYIGIKCGSAWCEISDDGAATPAPGIPAMEFPGSGQAESRRVRNIKGWHDAQRLARWDAATNKAVPSNVWAAVVPHPRLRQMTSQNAFSKGWTQVATIWASADYDGWVLRLERGIDNRIFLCYGLTDTCTDIPSEQLQLCGFDGSTRRWWAKTVHGTGASTRVEYRCVENYKHAPPPDVPGTARWRWLARDETTWTRCDQGCCKLQ